MKKIVLFITLALISSVGIAQRSGGGRPGGGQPRTSMSVRSASPSRSTISTPRTTTSYRPSTNSSINRPSVTRSSHMTTNPTPSVRNTPRMENNGQYGTRSSHNTPVATPHRPSHTPAPHHPGYNPHHYTHHPHHVPHGMHPAPPVHHPMHHRPIYMHYHVWHRWQVYNMYWYGYWTYVHTHPYDEVVVYVNNTRPSTQVIAIGTDLNYVYTIYKDELMDETYFTISDKDDNVLVKTIVNKKYCKIVTDGDGVWLFKKKDKDPIYFIYQDGKLYTYEED